MNPIKEGTAEPKLPAPSEHRPGIASPALDDAYDPIANAMARNPGLTSEQAEEIAKSFGF